MSSQDSRQQDQQQANHHGYASLSNSTETQPRADFPKVFTTTVTILSSVQLLLGLLTFLIAIFSTILSTNFVKGTQCARAELNDPSFLSQWTNADSAGTGIWVGLLIMLAAVVSLAGIGSRRRSWIKAHLVFNIIALLTSVAVVVTVSVTADGLGHCRRSGAVYHRTNHTTNHFPMTTPKPVVFYGEKLSGYSGRYFCSNEVITVWLAMDYAGIMFLVLLVPFTMTMIVFNLLMAKQGSRGGYEACCCVQQRHCASLRPAQQFNPTRAPTNLPELVQVQPTQQPFGETQPQLVQVQPTQQPFDETQPQLMQVQPMQQPFGETQPQLMQAQPMQQSFGEMQPQLMQVQPMQQPSGHMQPQMVQVQLLQPAEADEAGNGASQVQAILPAEVPVQSL